MDEPEARPSTRVHMVGSEWFSSSRGGLNRYFGDLYAALRAESQTVVTAQSFGGPDEGGASWGPTGGSTLSRVRASLRGPMLDERTVLDRHFALYGQPARSLRSRAHLVTHFHGPWAAESVSAGGSLLATRAKYWFERARYHSSELFVVLSQCFADVLAEEYRVDPAKIEIIPPGVDLARFSSGPVPEGPPTVLCVRRLEYRMGIDLLLSGWRAVRSAVPDAQLVIVGTGTQEAELRTQAHRLQLDDSVTFEGNSSDERLVDLYRQATVTAVPSRELEGFGLIALESLASGRAPIVTDVGGLPDSVRGFDDSLVIPAGDVDLLTDRLVSGLLGERPSPSDCRHHAEQFTWASCAKRHISAYQRLLQR